MTHTFLPYVQIHLTQYSGAGNIGEGEGTYADGDIVREGVVGAPSHPGGGEYSAGRGGVGNMVDPPNKGGSVEAIPETATKGPGDHYEDFHTGRAGAGNVHKEKYGGHTKPQTPEQKGKQGGGFVEKAKQAVGLDKKKEGEKS